MTHELVLTTADLDRLSIRCKTCEAEVTFSFAKLAENKPAEEGKKKPDFPAGCPVCSDDWRPIREAIQKLDHVLSELKQYGVTFRVLKSAPEKES